ncbi:hypothetical protein C0995_004733 [Termitomyces sp. Mi166|nr:hypothetical protein C0995_004733 [Termitomyces sp. Mi166\
MQKNIWVAAADGDLARVQASPSPLPSLSAHGSTAPRRHSMQVSSFSRLTVPSTLYLSSTRPQHPRREHLHSRVCPRLSALSSSSSPRPSHAAASYAQLHVLRFLLARGGNVNITDSDGDTPLYTVEDVQTARFLVEHGATIDHRNADGISVRLPPFLPPNPNLTPPQPIQHLSQDFPDVSAYLQSLLPASPTHPLGNPTPSQHAQDAEAEHLTSALMASVADIMQRAEAEGRDPDDELRAAVSRAVAQGVVAGYQLTSSSTDSSSSDSPSKRPRTDP